LCGIGEGGADVQRRKFVMSQTLTESRPEDRVIIMADVWLDQPEVLSRLSQLLSAYSETSTEVLVFMGPFVSSAASLDAQVHGFNALADLLGSHPELKDTLIVLATGPGDACMPSTLPQAPIPPSLIKKLSQKVKKLHVTSNPCRMSYFGQELVFFRHDLSNKMRRLVVAAPSGMDDHTLFTNALVETIVAQSHLCPMNTAHQSIYWAYDHALSMVALPDMLFLSDEADQYEWKESGCHAVNIGSFGKDGSFVVYWPAEKRSEFSQVK
jgi:DNA polymerase epsilon subunit 2